jgi:hypothetical protein
MPNGLELSCPAARASLPPFSHILAANTTCPLRQPAGSASASCYAPRAPRHLASRPAPLPLETLPPRRQPARRPPPRPLTLPRLPARTAAYATVEARLAGCPNFAGDATDPKPRPPCEVPCRYALPRPRPPSRARGSPRATASRPRPRTSGRLGGLTISLRDALADKPCVQAFAKEGGAASGA